MAMPQRAWSWLRNNYRRLLLVGFALVLVAAVGVVTYFEILPYHGTEASIDAVRDDGQIALSERDGNYVMEPTAGDTSAGLVFYSGGRVHPDAYLASLAPLVREANVTVVVVKMPLNLAVLDQNAADGVIERQAGIEQWYVGGHSLGGAMACRYARSNAERVDGLLLFGAYCDKSIADTDLRVLSVVGGADGVLNTESYEQNKANLPESANLESLPGLNHTHFGSYTGQDQPTGTSFDVAHRRLANVTVPWFSNASR